MFTSAFDPALKTGKTLAILKLSGKMPEQTLDEKEEQEMGIKYLLQLLKCVKVYLVTGLVLFSAKISHYKFQLQSVRQKQQKRKLDLKEKT